MRKLSNPIIFVLLLSFFQISSFLIFPMAFAADSNSDNIDDNLVVSFASAGIMNFPDTDAGETETISEIDFSTSATRSSNNYSTTTLTNGSTIQARRLFGTNANTYQNIGTGSGSIQLANAVVWGGADNTGQYAIPPQSNSTSGWVLTFTNTQRYLGLWWSAGNNDNNLQLIAADGTTILSPAFTTASIRSALLDGNSCPNSDAGRSTWADYRAYCGNPVRNASNAYSYSYVNEPYAFIHLRYEAGFRGVRFFGTGFEFDNLTFSETVPDTGATEETVGSVASDGPLPDVLLVDPRATTLSLPSSDLSGSNNANICFVQVANSSGGAISGSANISISQATSISGITATVGTNTWRYSGTRAAVQDQIPELRINGTSGNPVATTASKWIRIRLTHDTTDTDCETTSPANQQQIVEIRPLSVQGDETLNLDIE